MPVATCPNPADLERLFLGGLPADDADALEQHVLGCNSCSRRLEQLFRAKETLAAVLGEKSRHDAPADESVIADLIKKVESLRPAHGQPIQGNPMITLNCSTCQKKLSVKQELAGKKVKCPGCGQLTLFPAAVVAGAQNAEDLRTLPPAPNLEVMANVPPPPDASASPTHPPSEAPDNTVGVKPDGGHDSSLTDFLAAPQAPDELGRLGKYRILKILGHGGMGVVYKAEDTMLKRSVAIKAMLPTLAASASSGKRFLREAQTMAAVKHDHIASIYDVGEDRGVPFLAMEFLIGEPLDERLKRDEPLSLDEMLRIGREIADGLGAAHATGLIHRDIKPANIWLEDRNSTSRARQEAGTGASLPDGRGSCGRVKILDFGLARAATQDSGLTQQGVIIGTPAYMSPEQGRGDHVDHRCDLFSLGVVLYRMCTGQQPFQGKDTMSTLMALAMNDPAAPIQLNKAVPAELSELVMKLLEKDPEKRVKTAAEVVLTLQAIEKELIRKREAKENTVAVAVPITPKASVDQVFFAVEAPRPALHASVSMSLPSLSIALPPRIGRRSMALVAVALAAVFSLCCIVGAIYYWQTNNGTVRIEIDDPDIKVAFDKDGPTITGADKQPIKLSAGEHALHIKRGDLEFDTDKFILRRGADVTLKIEFLKGVNLQAMLGGKVIGQGSVEDAWIKMVAALPAEQQVKAVADKLKERNPGFNGKIESHKIDKAGVVTELEFFTDNVTDISPVRALPELRKLSVRGSGEWWWATGKLANLSPLKGMKLTTLLCGITKVSDLSPLKDMKLNELSCQATQVTDLSPLKDMKLTVLDIAHAPVSDLSPLKDMKLTWLYCHGTKVSDLAPLKGMPLTVLWCRDTKVSDLSALRGTPLIEFLGPFSAERDAEILRTIKTLTLINGKPAAQFWHEVDGAAPPSGPLNVSIVQKFEGHTDTVSSVAVSRNGKYAVTGSWDGTAILWETASGKKIQTFVQGVPKWLNGVALSDDGKLALIASADKTAFLVATGSGNRIQAFPGHALAVNCVALSADGKLVLTGSKDKTAILWDAASGKKIQTFLGHTAPVSSVALSADGKRILTGSADKTAILWEAASGKKIQNFQEHTDMVLSVALSGDGKVVLTGSRDGRAILWEAASGKKIQTFFQAANWRVTSVALSADAKLVVTASDDNKAFLWDAASGKKIHTFQGHTGAVWAVAIGADGKHVLTGSVDKTAILWAINAAPPPPPTVWSLDFDGNGKVNLPTLALKVDEPLTVEGWVTPRVQTSKPDPVLFAVGWIRQGINLGKNKWQIRMPQADPNKKQTSRYFWSDQDYVPEKRTHLAAVWSGKEMHFYVNGQLQDSHDKVLVGKEFEPRFVLGEQFQGQIHQCRVTKAERYTGPKDISISERFENDDKTLLLYRFDDGQGDKLTDSSGNGHHGKIVGAKWVKAEGTPTDAIVQKFLGHTDGVAGVALSGDGKLVLTGSFDKTAILWDAANGKKLQTFWGHTDKVSDVALSADGTRVLTGSLDKTAILWDAVSGKKIQTFPGHTDWVTGVALSGDGKHVLTGSRDKTAILWEAASGKKLQTFQGHTEPVWAVALSGDGKHVLTGSYDHTAILWDAASGKQIKTFKGHTKWIDSVALSRDGKLVLTGSYDHTAILWDAASGKKLRTLVGHVGTVYGVALSGDGKLAVTGAFDKKAILWEVASGKKLQTFQGHTDSVGIAALSRDGKYVLTGSADKTAILWAVNAAPPPASTVWSLDFDGNGRVNLPALALKVDEPLTVEAWVTPRVQTSDKNTVFGAGRIFQSIDRDTRRWRIWLPDGGPFGRNFWSDQEFAPGKRTHLAAVWSGKEIHFYVDGQLQSNHDTVTVPKEDHRFFFLGEKFQGQIHQFRVSKAERYKGPTVPISERFESDDKTLILYRFDEGQGDKLTDSSGNGHHGKIVGTKWVKAEAPPPGPWQPLLDAKLTGWLKYENNQPDAVSIVDREGETALRVRAGAKGAWLDTKQEFHNHHLTLEFQFPPGKAGEHRFAAGPSAGSLGGFAFGIRNDGSSAGGTWDALASAGFLDRGAVASKGAKGTGNVEFGNAVLHPTGVWNRLDLVRVDDSLACFVNGRFVGALADVRQIKDGKEAKFGKTHIAVNGKEGEVLIRRIEIRDINALPPELFATAPFPPLDPAWLKAVAAMKAEQQLEAVKAELMKRNPGFGKFESHKIEGGAVTELHFETNNVTDISPVRALRGLGKLNIQGGGAWEQRNGKLADLSPLKDMKLYVLTCAGTQVADLTPLKGMPLYHLEMSHTNVSDLAPLKDMNLGTLTCFGTKVSDLSPLKGMKLTFLGCSGTQVTDLGPLKAMPLKLLWCNFKPFRDTEILRSIKSLEHINGKGKAAFWKEVDAQQSAFDAWVKQVAAMKPEQQIEAVKAELMKRNPGFDGKFEAQKIEGGAGPFRVTELGFSTENVADISPVRVLTGLRKLVVEAGRTRGQRNGKLADLSPLQGMELTDLRCHDTQVSDLAPLKGMKLTYLDCAHTQVSDLAPLKDMKLTTLYCFSTQVSDLAALKDMKLTTLSCTATNVSDLSPLRGMPLKSLGCNFEPKRDAEILRSIKTLETINGQPREAFWKEVDAKKAGK